MKYIAKHILSISIALLIVFCSSGVAVAVGEDTDITNKSQTESAENPVRKTGEKPALGEGEAGVLVDAATGNVLFENNSTRQMYPASTTKIMTALLAIESVQRGEASMDSQITVTAEMLADLDPDGTNMALKEGEILSLDSLLKGLLIPSGNDAAMAIAYFIGGSPEAFVDMMNERAQQLGCMSTHFANPHGLHDDYHYTTAEDMSKIACEAMKLFEFRNIVDCAHIKIPPTNKTEQERYYINTNGLLSTMRYLDYFYKGSIGVKTGYTQDAGNCLVSAVTRNGMEFIGVILGGKNISSSHKDSIEMFDWGFETFSPLTPISKGDTLCEIKVKQSKGGDTLTLSATSAVTVIAPKGTNADSLELIPEIPDSITAPVSAGETVGKIKVYLNGEELGSCNLIADTDVKRSIFWPVMAIGDFLWNNTITRTIICLCGAAIVIFILLFVTAMYRNIKTARRRRRRKY